MNTLLNIKAFLLVSRTGSFSGAARELGVAPSVVTKRITRLEDEMGAQLFVRSTRALSLTTAGERLLPQYQRLVAELDEIIGAAAATERGIEGHLRIKGPTTLTSLFLGPIFCEFHAQNPGLTMEIVLLDRSASGRCGRPGTHILFPANCVTALTLVRTTRSPSRKMHSQARIAHARSISA